MTRRSFSLSALALAALFAASGSLRADTTGPALAESAVLESNVVYLRVSHVAATLAGEIGAAQSALAATNQIAGTVLDLRFADGADSEAAKAAANLFAAKKLPLAILVNSETRGEAVVLASTLREAREGLVFGSETQGTKTAGPIQPDIVVKVGLEDERAFMENPYAAPAPAGTNTPAATNNLLPFVEHTSEADLVRAKIKDGEEGENFPPARKSESPKPSIHDPVLARAVDLLKGLAVVRASHS